MDRTFKLGRWKLWIHLKNGCLAFELTKGDNIMADAFIRLIDLKYETLNPDELKET